MLTLTHIGDINPFDWDAFRCPLCHGNQFTSIDHAGVYCDCCNARFVVRDTAGDPGCVVDCLCTREQGGHVYAPAYRCKTCDNGCGNDHGRFDHEDKTCPCNLNHGEMTRRHGISVPWNVPKTMERFCLVLKLGDYCSGWMFGNDIGNRVPGPTQAEWDEWQERRRAQIAWVDANPVIPVLAVPNL